MEQAPRFGRGDRRVRGAFGRRAERVEARALQVYDRLITDDGDLVILSLDSDRDSVTIESTCRRFTVRATTTFRRIK